MTIDEMKKRKKELGYSNAKLAELSGVPVGTVQKVLSGETESPRYCTVQALTKALEEINWDDINELREAEPAYSFKPNAHNYESSVLCSPTAAFGDGEGDKTIDDYMALPEGTRVEMINGHFYNMAAPTTIHQRIRDEIFAEFRGFIRQKGGRCIAFTSPTDVQLDCDNKTMVQPDVLVVSDRNKITKERIVGAPDLTVEVVSPSNPLMDALVKMIKYRDAGVREYWIVFPDEKRVMVYDFEKSAAPKTYSFEEKVPVNIWDGDCEVDFKFIYSQIDFMYDV